MTKPKLEKQTINKDATIEEVYDALSQYFFNNGNSLKTEALLDYYNKNTMSQTRMSEIKTREYDLELEVMIDSYGSINEDLNCSLHYYLDKYGDTTNYFYELEITDNSKRLPTALNYFGVNDRVTYQIRKGEHRNSDKYEQELRNIANRLVVIKNR